MTDQAKQPAAAKALKPKGKGKLVLLQVLLGLNVVLVLLVVGVVLNIIPKPTLQASTTPESPALPEAPTQPRGYQFPHQQPLPTRTPALIPTADLEHQVATKVVSWRDAEKAYAQESYSRAAEMFGQMVLNSRHKASDVLVVDYFLLRQCQSLSRLGKIETARKALRQLVGNSLSPIIRGVAAYELAIISLGEGKFMLARSQAYQAMAALGALERPMKMEADCRFMICRALSEKVRSFKTSRKLVPWGKRVVHDPFTGLTKMQLRELLAEGKGLLNPSALGPELNIRRKPLANGYWEINSSGLTVEEVLNQFGHKVGKDIKWGRIAARVRRRPVVLYYQNAPTQEILEVSSGMAGLLGRFTLNEMYVYDPMGQAASSEMSRMITREAISSWRRFILRHSNDSRIPMGNFALAAISEWNGQPIEACSKYQILASRFERSRVAPEALLRCARLKVDMMDYRGAKGNLLDLLDMYPDHTGADRVYLMLAEINETAADKAGSLKAKHEYLQEATDTFEKLYYRNLSSTSRNKACFGAGRCLLKDKKYSASSKWLARYVAGLSKPNPNEYAQAYYMLGQAEAAQNHLKVAAQAFHRSLIGSPKAETRIPTLLYLASVYRRMDEHVMALGVLDKLQKERLGSEQAVQALILRSRIYNDIGLIDKARASLRMERGAIKHPQLRGFVDVALARSHIAAGDYESARKLLNETLGMLSGGEALIEASTLLAEVCLELKQPQQVLTVGNQILKSNPNPEALKRVRKCMGEAYLMVKQYDKAATMFAGPVKSPLQKALETAQAKGAGK